MVFNDVEAEPVLQEVTEETSNHGANNKLLCFENLCMYIARNYNYPTAVFFLLCIGFYKTLIKLLLLLMMTMMMMIIIIIFNLLVSLIFCSQFFVQFAKYNF